MGPEETEGLLGGLSARKLKPPGHDAGREEVSKALLKISVSEEETWESKETIQEVQRKR